MDPDANLLEQRRVRQRILKALDGPQYRTDNHETTLDDANRLCELVQALDEENAERGLDLGLGSKLRELGLLWARGRKKDAGAKAKRK